MVSLFGILNIGQRGIAAAQAGLDTTGHNIANANTEGYSRQRVVQGNSNPLVTANGSFGMGVEVNTVERVRDMFLEGQIRSAQSDTSYNEEMENLILRIEAALSDPLTSISDTQDQSSVGGMNNLLSRFFRAFHELSNNPESPELRTAALEEAISLSDTLNTISGDLREMREDMNSRTDSMVEEMNRISAEIAKLNKKIVTTESREKINANDWQDRRDQLLGKLSELAPITTETDKHGAISVSLAGERIVDGAEQVELQTEVVEKSKGIQITSIRIGKAGVDTLDGKILGGKLGAVLDTRDRLLPFVQNDIDSLARSIINEVNKIHAGATGLEGHTSLNSEFKVPHGATKADTQKTLDRIFNQPNLPKDASLGEHPFSIQDGAFTLRTTDEDNQTIDSFDVNVSTEDTLFDLVERMNRSDGVVQEARSAFTFDPVFVQNAVSQKTIPQEEEDATLAELGITQGYPIAEGGGPFTFEIHMRDRAGNAIDSDPDTKGVQPYTVTFNETDTLEDVAGRIQSATDGKVRGHISSSENSSRRLTFSLKTFDRDQQFSIQNDNSGIVQALDFPITDPNQPLAGGQATRAAASFEGDSSDSFLGSGNPAFSPAFPGPPPSVISEGTMELVVLDSQKNPTITTITVGDNEVNSMDELANAISNADENLNAQITDDQQLIINGENHRSFFFQNDETGLVEALGFEDLQGQGEIGDQPFTDGSFEIVVANEKGMVTSIFEVPMEADPSTVGGVMSLQGIVDQINNSAAEEGAPIQASIVKDPTNPSQNTMKVEAAEGFEFTFRSDDSTVLSALGFTDGPALEETGENPILSAESSVSIGDQIGGLVRARFNDQNGIEISTTNNQRLSFTGDSSHVLAAMGINSLFQGSDAESMRVNQNVVENSQLLATSKNGKKGNNEAANDMADLENKKVMQGKTLGESYRSMISKLGLEGSRVSQFLKTNDKILRELKTLQEQNSGVSLDEESINLIRYQQAFQASARVISTVDRLMDLIVNQLGA